MTRDYGFDLPDRRHGFYTTDGGFVSVNIIRHWYQTEDDETNFKVSFEIIKGNETTRLPIGSNESKAIEIAHTLYEEDTEVTEDYDDTEAIYAAERRMGT